MVNFACNTSIFYHNMRDFKDLVQLRRSHRQFTDEEVNADDVKLILRAALMSPSAKSIRGWHFIVVDDKMTIQKLSDSKENGAQFLANAPLAIVIVGDPVQNDCWIEDGSIAATMIQLQVEDLGLGSCWAQMRGRGLSDGTMATEVIRGILGIPENFEVLCVIGIGHKADDRKPQNEDKLLWEQVHINKF
jgi:nitroreductase